MDLGMSHINFTVVIIVHCGTLWATVSHVAGICDQPGCGETFFLGIHSCIFGKHHIYSLYHDPSSKIMSCESCHLRQIKKLWINGLSMQKGDVCSVCADLDYMAKHILDRDILYIASKPKAKDFGYPKIIVEGSPPPPIERPIGLSDKAISPYSC
jgi:hypothetical protein